MYLLLCAANILKIITNTYIIIWGMKILNMHLLLRLYSDQRKEAWNVAFVYKKYQPW